MQLSEIRRAEMLEEAVGRCTVVPPLVVNSPKGDGPKGSNPKRRKVAKKEEGAAPGASSGGGHRSEKEPCPICGEEMKGKTFRPQCGHETCVECAVEMLHNWRPSVECGKKVGPGCCICRGDVLSKQEVKELWKLADVTDYLIGPNGNGSSAMLVVGEDG